MNESGYRYPTHLDPGAQEFFPAIYIPYPAPPPPPPPAAAVYVPPPPQPQPVHLPPPTRAILLSMVEPPVSESTVRRDLEIFGDVRAVQMERRRQGLVTVHFYDVRDAESALVAIQQQHMQQQYRIGQHYDAVYNGSFGYVAPPPPPPPAATGGLVGGRVVWAQFVCPVTSELPDGNNHGTLVVFNLDSRVSSSYLQDIFQAFGPVKELRETPNKRNQKFVEFYDVRSAAAALAEMNGKEIFGRSIIVDFSRPGGQAARNFRKGPPNANVNKSSGSQSRNLPHSSHMGRNMSPRALLNHSRRTSGESRSSSSTGSSVQGSMSKLSISGYEECSSGSKKGGGYRKMGGSGGGNGSGSSKSGGKWKSGGGSGGRNGNEYDPKFLINEDGIMESNSRDSRTTVMIKNIPNKYSQKLLLNMLDNHCIHSNEQIAEDGDDLPLSSYDFVYLPIDFVNKCNVGYGFVNMTSPEATLRLYKAFHHQSWEVFNSRKICEVTYARLQGLDALREHFKNSKFPNNAGEYMPVVFSPPRDGQTLTDPSPLVNRSSSVTSLSLSPQSSATSSKENQTDSPCDRIYGTELEPEEVGCGSGYGGYDERETVNA